MAQCLLCQENAVTTRQENSSRVIYNCPSCGLFVVSDLAVKAIQANQREVLSFIRSRRISGNSDTVLISFDKANLDKSYIQLTVDQITDMFPKSFSEQMEKALSNLVFLSDYPGHEIRVESLDMSPLFYLKAVNFDAMSFIIRAMEKAKLIEVNYLGSSFFPCGVTVSPEGWDLVALAGQGDHARKVALLISDRHVGDMSVDIRSASQKAVKEFGYQLQEADTISPDSRVGNALVSQIKASNLVLCDLTGASPEAYYAVGYAQALRKPVLITCHESEKKKLMLDPVHTGVVFWGEQKQLYLELRNFIYAKVQ